MVAEVVKQIVGPRPAVYAGGRAKVAFRGGMMAIPIVVYIVAAIILSLVGSKRVGVL